MDKSMADLKARRQRYKDSEIYFTRVSVKLCNSKDMDIIAKLQEQESKNDYIKRLIRDDIRRNGNVEDCTNE